MKKILHSTAVVFLSIGCITIIQSCEENLLTSNQSTTLSTTTSTTSTTQNLVKVTDCNYDGTGWILKPANALNNSIYFVTGPSTPPLGIGSIKVNAPADGTYKRILINSYSGLAFSDLVQFSYSTYVETACMVENIPTDNFFLGVIIDPGDGTESFPLVFNEVYQTGNWIINAKAPDQGIQKMEVWQNWDLLNGVWWKGSSTGTPIDPDHGGEYHSLKTWKKLYPKAKIGAAIANGSIRISAGGPASLCDFTGYVDNFVIGFQKDNFKTFDFEPCIAK